MMQKNLSKINLSQIKGNQWHMYLKIIKAFDKECCKRLSMKINSCELKGVVLS